jgi:hypothetical protein
MASLSAESVKFLIIHSSLTSSTQAVTLKDLERKHRMAGKLSIGYHFVITRGGVLETGRPLTQVGQHTPGHNQHSIGICLIGGVDKKGNPQDNYTPQQYKTLEYLLANLSFKFPKAVAVGHNHVSPSNPCPCFPVMQWLRTRGLDHLNPN